MSRRHGATRGTRSVTLRSNVLPGMAYVRTAITGWLLRLNGPFVGSCGNALKLQLGRVDVAFR